MQNGALSVDNNLGDPLCQNDSLNICFLPEPALTTIQGDGWTYIRNYFMNNRCTYKQINKEKVTPAKGQSLDK